MEVTSYDEHKENVVTEMPLPVTPVVKTNFVILKRNPCILLRFKILRFKI